VRLEQLQAFLAVTETKSFQQAAQRCGVTQSTISRQVQSLEAELGMPVFHRNAQAKLTVAGDRLLYRARKICHEWSQAVAEFEELRQGKQPELCVAVIHSVCAYHLPPVLQEFCHSYPEVQLRVTSLGSDRALKVLRDGLVDAAIVMNNRFLTASSDMVVDSLFEEPIEIMMAASHPLAQHNQVPWTELAQFPQVVFKDGYGMQRLVQEQFQRQNLELKSILELNTLDAFRGIVKRGSAVALLPRSAMSDIQADSTLTTRSTAPQILTREVVLVTTRDRLDIPPIQHFRNLVKTLIVEDQTSFNGQSANGQSAQSLIAANSF